MNWRRFLGAVAVLGVTISAIGSLLTFGKNGLLTGPYTGPAVLTVLLVAVGVIGAIGLGVRSSRFRSNPYW